MLVQELFQCKLTRKGTLAPSDRQSRLRKSISINGHSNEPIESEHINPYSRDEQNVNRVRFAGSTITSSLSSMNSFQSSINKNTRFTNKNGIDF